jgi:hypothetical protein
MQYDVARALVRAASALVPTLVFRLPEQVSSLDTARRSARATTRV